jgi:hypothetical protein
MRTVRLAILLSLLLASLPCLAQKDGNEHDVITPSLTLSLANMPQPVSSATVTPKGNPGARTFYYWIVTNTLIGQSAPAGPFELDRAPDNYAYNYPSDSLKTGAYVYFPPSNGLSYDLLRTTTPTPPSGTCVCAVLQSITPGSSGEDGLETPNSYTLNPVDPNAYKITLQNIATGAGASQLEANGSPLGASTPTAAQIASAISSSQTGCATAGYVWVPKSNTCVAQSEGSSSASPSILGPCDILAAAGTPCVAAHSLTRRMLAAYSGNLFQLTRLSDSTTTDIGALTTGAADVSTAQAFCLNTVCWITDIYDQMHTPTSGNNLPQANTAKAAPLALIGWGAGNIPIARILADGNSHPILGFVPASGEYYRNRASTVGMPTGNSPITIYEVMGTADYSVCCAGYGDMEAPLPTAGGRGMMFATTLAIGNSGTFGLGSGPWPGVDWENGVFMYGPTPTPPYISTLAKYSPTSASWALKSGDATTGVFNTLYSGSLPSGATMALQGGISLGEGGDASPSPQDFLEGAIVASTTTDGTDALLQSNITSFYGELTTAAPSFYPADGKIYSGMPVTIFTATGVSVCYTTDGTTPIYSGGTCSHGTQLASGGGTTAITSATTVIAVAMVPGAQIGWQNYTLAAGHTPPTFVTGNSACCTVNTNTESLTLNVTAGQFAVVWCRTGTVLASYSVSSSPSNTFLPNPGGYNSYSSGSDELFYAFSLAGGSTTFTCNLSATSNYAGIEVLLYDPGSLSASGVVGMASYANANTSTGIQSSARFTTTSGPTWAIMCADQGGLGSTMTPWDIGPSAATLRQYSTADALGCEEAILTAPYGDVVGHITGYVPFLGMGAIAVSF